MTFKVVAHLAAMMEMEGRRVHGIQVESMDGQVTLPLPTWTECVTPILNDWPMIIPQVALCHPHLQFLAKEIPELDPEAPITLLFEKDIG